MNQFKRGTQRFSTALGQQPFSSALDVFFMFFASWTLVWNLVYFFGLNLSITRYALALLFLCSPIILFLKPDDVSRRAEERRAPELQGGLLLLLFITAGVILTLCLNRPDADDEHFLSWTFSLVSKPYEPVNALPGYQSTDRALVGYEPLRAALAHLTGTPVLYWYYLVAPAVVGGFAVVANWAMLRELVGEYWPVGMLFFFVVMLAWADAHRTPANFAFVRFFHGKSALINLIVPAIFYYFFRYYQAPGRRYYLLLLGLVLVSGVGFSRGAIIIGPLVLGSLMIVSLRKSELKGALRIAILLALVTLPLAWVLSDQIGAGNGVHTEHGYAASTTNEEMYGFVAGKGLRAYLILLMTGLSVYAVTNRALRSIYHKWVLMIFLLLAAPWTSTLFGNHVHVYMSWRWLWMIPFPIMAGVAITGLYRWTESRSGFIRGSLALAAAVSLFVLSSPKLIVSELNYTTFGWPRFTLASDSIHLLHFGKTATVKDGRLFLEGDSQGY